MGIRDTEQIHKGDQNKDVIASPPRVIFSRIRSSLKYNFNVDCILLKIDNLDVQVCHAWIQDEQQVLKKG